MISATISYLYQKSTAMENHEKVKADEPYFVGPPEELENTLTRIIGSKSVPGKNKLNHKHTVFLENIR